MIILVMLASILSVVNLVILGLLISKHKKIKLELKTVTELNKKVENVENRVRLLRSKGIIQ